MRLFKSVKPRPYLPIFNENLNWFLLYLGFFYGTNGSSVKDQEVKAYIVGRLTPLPVKVRVGTSKN